MAYFGSSFRAQPALLSLALVLPSGLSGCAGVPRPPPLVTQEKAAHLRILLASDGEYRIGDPACAEHDPAFKAAWRNEVQSQLLASGFEIASDPTAPHDIEASLGGSIDHCSSWDGYGGTLTLTLKRNGAVVEQLNNPYHGGTDSTPVTAAGYLVRVALIEPLLQSTRVARLADDLAQQTSPPSPAATPPPEPVASAVAPQVSAPPAPAPSEAPPAYAVHLKRGAPQPNAFALVIGVEKYRDVPGPLGARSDAQRFAELAKLSLGIPSDQVLVDLDEHASKSDLDKHLAWLSSNVPADGRIYFYFAGHGSPDSAGGAYLLPYDGDPKSLSSSAYRVDEILSTLGKTKAKEVIAFVDACYSGAGGRSVLPAGARPLVKVVQPKVTSAKTGPREALFSSAGASEISGPMPGQPVGLFTQMLLRGAGAGEADVDGDGNVSLDELGLWVPPRVSREAKKDNRDQTPSLLLAATFGDPKTVRIASGLTE